MTLDFDLPYDILSHKLLNYLINIPIYIYIYIYIVGVLGPRAHCLYIYIYIYILGLGPNPRT